MADTCYSHFTLCENEPSVRNKHVLRRRDLNVGITRDLHRKLTSSRGGNGVACNATRVGEMINAYLQIMNIQDPQMVNHSTFYVSVSVSVSFLTGQHTFIYP